MNYYKKFIIKLSPYANVYSDLIISNCLNNINEKKNSLDMIFDDKELTNILYNIIVYGKLTSVTNKKLNVHSLINSLDKDEKHLMCIEVERFQRLYLYLDFILLFSLFSSFIFFILSIYFYK